MPAPQPPLRDSDCTWTLCTPAIPGAVAIVQLTGHIESALARLGIKPVGQGQIVLRSLAGIDTGLVARWSLSSAQLMPHGGAAVTRALTAALESSGIRQAQHARPQDVYPEAEDEIEAHMLAALAGASSPLAIGCLLDAPLRWKEHARGLRPACAAETSRQLSRLLHAPLVVALGPANVGKSTLINALAGRNVSIVANEPGTTRDHVGVSLELAGLVVRYVDTPGMRPNVDQPEREAQAIAEDLARAADLILLVGDAHSPPPVPHGFAPPCGVLRIALREDLVKADWTADVRVSARTGEGLAALASRIREQLVSTAALRDAGAWRFWDRAATPL